MSRAVLVIALACGGPRPLLAQQNGELSPAQIQELMSRVTANQHRNDDALMLYERREHRVTRKHAEDPAAHDDKLFRVVPTGTGTLKLILAEHNVRVSEQNYKEQLRTLEQALVWALDPNESRQRARVQKYQRRAKERYDTVEAARDAFVCSWAGREELAGSLMIKLQCVPNPSFQPASRAQEMFQSARATLWIEPRSAQLARVEAEMTRDVSVGGGVIGKIYRGGRFLMEQIPVAPGVWLPSRFQYNARGRKFLFGFEMHESTLVTHYKRIGPPSEALAAIRTEMRGAAVPVPSLP